MIVFILALFIFANSLIINDTFINEIEIENINYIKTLQLNNNEFVIFTKNDTHLNYFKCNCSGYFDSEEHSLLEINDIIIDDEYFVSTYNNGIKIAYAMDDYIYVNTYNNNLELINNISINATFEVVDIVISPDLHDDTYQLVYVAYNNIHFIRKYLNETDVYPEYRITRDDALKVTSIGPYNRTSANIDLTFTGVRITLQAKDIAGNNITRMYYSPTCNIDFFNQTTTRFNGLNFVNYNEFNGIGTTFAVKNVFTSISTTNNLYLMTIDLNYLIFGNRYIYPYPYLRFENQLLKDTVNIASTNDRFLISWKELNTTSNEVYPYYQLIYHIVEPGIEPKYLPYEYKLTEKIKLPLNTTLMSATGFGNGVNRFLLSWYDGIKLYVQSYMYSTDVDLTVNELTTIVNGTAVLVDCVDECPEMYCANLCSTNSTDVYYIFSGIEGGEFVDEQTSQVVELNEFTQTFKVKANDINSGRFSFKNYGTGMPKYYVSIDDGVIVSAPKEVRVYIDNAINNFIYIWILLLCYVLIL